MPEQRPAGALNGVYGGCLARCIAHSLAQVRIQAKAGQLRGISRQVLFRQETGLAILHRVLHAG
jgi:hypothetical protein